MKDTKEQNTDLLKLSLYLISLWILFFMLIVLKMDISTIPFKLKLADIGEFLYRNSVSGICFVFILLGGVGYWWFKDSLNNAKQLPVEIRECESINYENLSFLATYIIPLVCFPMETDREVFVMFSVIVIIGCIFVKTDLYYTNPSLILLGFNVYRVRTNSGKEFRQGIAIIKGKLKKGDNIKYLPLSDNVYFGRVVKREDKRVKK
nr:anti-phage protein KwaA [uncultured Acetatifactor sp.]